jgi:hypothetical protein
MASYKQSEALPRIGQGAYCRQLEKMLVFNSKKVLLMTFVEHYLLTSQE